MNKKNLNNQEKPQKNVSVPKMTKQQNDIRKEDDLEQSFFDWTGDKNT